MIEPMVIGFYGESGSGKTSIIVEIIKRLTNKNIRIATIKMSNKINRIDLKGKDTWKFSDAGSQNVVYSSNKETVFFINERLDSKRIFDILYYIKEFDVILIEGVNDPDIPKIKIGKNIKLRENTIYTYNGNLNETVDFINSFIFKSNSN